MDHEGGSRISQTGNQTVWGPIVPKFPKKCVKRGTLLGACSMPGVIPFLGSTDNYLKNVYLKTNVHQRTMSIIHQGNFMSIGLI